MQVITCKNTTSNPLSSFSTVSATHSRQIKFLSGVLPLQFNCKLPRTRVSTFVDCSGFADGRTQKWKIIRGQELGQLRHSSDTRREIGAVNGSKGESLSPGDEKPYELLPGGRRAYLDEQDIVTFLDPPKELIPLDPASYNPAVYLWKKIGDIPEERRHRLIYLLKPRLISRVWEIAGTRYEDSKLAKKSASSLISTEDSEVPVEVWDCRTSGGPFPISWINFFNKAVFHCKDGKTYGRIAFGHEILEGDWEWL
ncbi:PREDICTED: uncharacterized protein LOC104612355 isoform X2 [Nelumbo nucifera]|uniref:Uncharacterized protein LOC104612355 isoform X2 n=1 Tax=Nelumbo nucifera TaxID=4432 RepID=A0A1U8BDP5_NELNU|nr:PREDICTED: uncharacterized protein LOC104612355 isoform X2 [Nelumbo nucifera]